MNRRVGVEIELVCPVGSTRHLLAQRLAKLIAGAHVKPDVHYDTQPSLHPEIEIFHSVGPASEVVDCNGELVARLRDDSSIVEDLLSIPPVEYRRDPFGSIVSDDRRVLRILGSQIDPQDLTGDSLDDACHRLDLKVSVMADGRKKVLDADGTTVALTGTVSPERSRVAEIVSPVLGHRNVACWLQLVCRAAREHGCIAPAEGAVHLHFDAAPFDRPERLARLVRWFDSNHDGLREHYRTNLQCRTLGRFDPAFVAAATEIGDQPWPEKRQALFRLHRSRSGDVNINGLLHQAADKHTIELRFLPVSIDQEILSQWIYELGGALTLLALDEVDTSSPFCPAKLRSFLNDAAGLRSLGPEHQ